MELDRHRLAEERTWRRVNYQRQVRKFVSSIVDAIQQEAKRVLEREITYSDDARDEFSYVDQAGQLQHAILQAVNNADFGGLTRDAGDLHAVEMALHTLAKLMLDLPAETRELIETREDERQLALLEATVAERERRQREDAARCRAGVHNGGRGGGFHRCSKRGVVDVAVDGRPGYLGRAVAGSIGSVEIKLCRVHAKEFEKAGVVNVWTPSDWESGQAEIAERKALEKIERLRTSLPPQISARSEP